MSNFHILVTILAFGALASSATSTVSIHPSLTQTLKAKGTANIIVRMSSGTERVLSQIKQTKFLDRGSKLTSLTNALKSNAAESQRSVLDILTTFENLKYQSLWISNEIYIPNANSDIIERLSNIPGIAEIREEHVVQLESSKISRDSPGVSHAPLTLEPNIIRVEAYRVWEELGITGENAVVSSIDTGVRGSHISLHGNFLGDYGWFDPPLGAIQPDDFIGQGTHSMGVMVGKYGIGVAPEAKWMACRGCEFACQENWLTSCAQFILCPTLANGTMPDCSKAPHVVNNAWFTLGGDPFFNPSILAWKTAGIIPVFTAGNNGPGCDSIRSPGDSTVGVIAVSSTTNEDGISMRSSQGPSFYGQIKPDIVAPGEYIISASIANDTAYQLMLGAGSGTAHVVGTIALLKSTLPELNYEDVTTFLYNNVDRTTNSSGQNCGGVSETEFPNNSVGWGRLNAFKTVNSAINSASAKQRL